MDFLLQKQLFLWRVSQTLECYEHQFQLMKEPIQTSKCIPLHDARWIYVSQVWPTQLLFVLLGLRHRVWDELIVFLIQYHNYFSTASIKTPSLMHSFAHTDCNMRHNVGKPCSKIVCTGGPSWLAYAVAGVHHEFAWMSGVCLRNIILFKWD